MHSVFKRVRCEARPFLFVKAFMYHRAMMYDAADAWIL